MASKASDSSEKGNEEPATQVPAIEKLASFTLFPKLAAEIQTMVWKEVGEAIVQMKPPSQEAGNCLGQLPLNDKIHTEYMLIIWAQALADLPGRSVTIGRQQPKAPALLQTCTEARKQGLKLYIRQTIPDPEWDDLPPFIIFIDFEKDTLMLSGRKNLENPQGNFPDSYLYRAERSDGSLIAWFKILWNNNIVFHSIHHHAELCKRIKYLTVRAKYVTWLGRSVTRAWGVTLASFCRTQFPRLEKITLVSVGQEDSWEILKDMLTQDVVDEVRQDEKLFDVLDQTYGKQVTAGLQDGRTEHGPILEVERADGWLQDLTEMNEPLDLYRTPFGVAFPWADPDI